MTEQEWLACEDPHKLLVCVQLYFRYSHLAKDIQKAFESPICGEERYLLAGLPRQGNPFGRCWNELANITVHSRPKAANVIREIVGNPFRPVEFEPPATLYPCPNCRGKVGATCPLCYGTRKREARCSACYDKRQIWTGMDGMKWVPCVKCKDWLPESWLTSAVLSMAQAIVERGEFDQMPMLADALEEAGCDNQEILQHCRGMAPNLNTRTECPGCSRDWGHSYCGVCKGSGYIKYKDGWLPKSVPCLPGCWVLRTILDSDYPKQD